MACFGLTAAGRFIESGLYFFLLLAIREFLASYFFLTRREAAFSAGVPVMLFAFVSSAMPLLYSWGVPTSLSALTIAEVCSVIGFTLAALATVELGDRLSISPERRGEFCKRGVYKYIHHPMYIGYFIAETGLVIAFPQNRYLYVASMLMYLIRAKLENRIQKRRA
ncbi:MAG: DUF1295 domain-containing protein [Proteobacteria bacterium]|nr:MAG: DUF1295 domain-containing protein [Pseudomonadota bacterium]